MPADTLRGSVNGVFNAGRPASSTTASGTPQAAVGPRVSLVPATLAKGLEFDHVVVAEPAAIVEAEPRGLRRLYVVLTRAVSRLVVGHRRALPAELTEQPVR